MQFLTESDSPPLHLAERPFRRAILRRRNVQGTHQDHTHDQRGDDDLDLAQAATGMLVGIMVDSFNLKQER